MRKFKRIKEELRLSMGIKQPLEVASAVFIIRMVDYDVCDLGAMVVCFGPSVVPFNSCWGAEPEPGELGAWARLRCRGAPLAPKRLTIRRICARSGACVTACWENERAAAPGGLNYSRYPRHL